MKKNNKKGFTLAELLIVVAIIAVLVAVAIPVFNAQLEKSRDATSVANIRSAYAEAVTSLLTGGDNGSTGHVTYNVTSGAGSIQVSGVKILTQKADSWNGTAAELPLSVTDGGTRKSNATVTFTVSGGEITAISYS